LRQFQALGLHFCDRCFVFAGIVVCNGLSGPMQALGIEE